MHSIKLKAQQLKDKYGTNSPFEILSQMGVSVSYQELPSQTDGFFFELNGNLYVVISDRLEGDEAAAVAAHELGHIVLHDTCNSLFIQLYTNIPISQLEQQADFFAACLLIDDETLEHSEYDSSVTVYDIARMNRVPLRYAVLYTHKVLKVECQTCR